MTSNLTDQQSFSVPISSPNLFPSEPKPPKRVMLTPLTGVRAVAAIGVLIGHFSPYLILLLPFIEPYSRVAGFGYLGVDLFFVLSGFILTHNYVHEFKRYHAGDHARFLWLRLARVYPVHLFTLLVLVAGIVVGKLMHQSFNKPEWLTPLQFVENLLLVNAWTPGGHPSWNVPAWSISAEWLAYLCFPFITLFVVRVKNATAAWAGYVAIFALMFGLYHYQPFFDSIFGKDSPPIRILCEFIAGCMLYRVYQFKWCENVAWSAVAIVAFGAAVAMTFFVEVPSLAPAPLLGLLVLALARVRGPIAWFFGSRVMIFLGEASYALYMTHEVTRMFMFKFLKPDKFAHAGMGTRVGVICVWFAVVFAIAIGTYLFVETPAREVMRKIVGRRRKPVEQVPTAVPLPDAIPFPVAIPAVVPAVVVPAV